VRATQSGKARSAGNEGEGPELEDHARGGLRQFASATKVRVLLAGLTTIVVGQAAGRVPGQFSAGSGEVVEAAVSLRGARRSKRATMLATARLTRAARMAADW
jgi:hypothetical protein